MYFRWALVMKDAIKDISSYGYRVIWHGGFECLGCLGLQCTNTSKVIWHQRYIKIKINYVDNNSRLKYVGMNVNSIC